MARFRRARRPTSSGDAIKAINAEIACALAELKKIEAGDVAERGEAGKFVSRRKIAKGCLTRARALLKSYRAAIGEPSASNIETRIAGVAGRVGYTEPRASGAGNGRRQAGLGLVLKQKGAPAKRRATAPRPRPIKARKVAPKKARKAAKRAKAPRDQCTVSVRSYERRRGKLPPRDETGRWTRTRKRASSRGGR